MAGIRSIFVSAPKVKIKIGGQALAYAIGLSLSIDVSVENVFSFSRFDSAGPEALQYGIVSGSIQIVKLASNSNSTLRSPTRPADALSIKPSDEEIKAANNQNAGNTSRLADHLDPTRVLASETFDLEILVNHFNSVVDPKIDTEAGGSSYSLYVIKDCRLGGSNINISLGSLINEPVTFQGLLLVDTDAASASTANQISSDDLTKDGN